MIESGSAIDRRGVEENNRKVEGVRLLKLSLFYLVFQLTISWIGNVLFSSSTAASRFVHSFFVNIDDFTPALARLKALYRLPIDGREFSQVFSIYFFLLTLLCICLIVLCGFLFSRKIRNLQWKKMVVRDYAMLLLIFGLSFWTVYFFYIGPSTSLRNYRDMFGTDFIGSACLLLPLAQFLCLSIFAFYYAIGGNSRQKS